MATTFGKDFVMVQRRQPIPMNRIINRMMVFALEDGADEPIPVWAGRQDFSARDTLTFANIGAVTIHDTRYYVADVPGGLEWRVGDTFQDDEGLTWTVRGIAEFPDVRQLELLARGVG